MLFFSILPILNGLLDWLSWWISRRLGGHLLNRPHGMAIFAHIALDFVFAFLALGLLAVFLTGGIELFNQLALFVGNESSPLILDDLLKNSYLNPWSVDSGWIMVMLITTLFPTFGHLVLVIWASVTYVTPRGWRYKMIRNLRQRGADGEPIKMKFDGPAHYFTARWFLAIGVVSLLSIGVIWAIKQTMVPVGEILYQLAMTSIRLAGG